MPYRTISLAGLPPFRISVHSQDDQFISPEILKTGRWEPLETEVILRCLQGGCDFYDVGANLGWYSIVAGLALADHEGTVHAFEPSMENAQLLLHNVLDNRLSNVRVSPCAMGTKTGPIELRLSAENKGDHQAHEGSDSRHTARASMTRFDRYHVPSHRRVFMKIDTQGSELAIIEGMGTYLQSIENLSMLIEFWPLGLEHAPGSADRLIKMLAGAGFRAYSLTEDDPHLRPAPWDVLAAAVKARLAPSTGRFINLLLVRDGDPIAGRVADLLEDEISSHIAPINI